MSKNNGNPDPVCENIRSSTLLIREAVLLECIGTRLNLIWLPWFHVKGIPFHMGRLTELYSYDGVHFLFLIFKTNKYDRTIHSRTYKFLFISPRQSTYTAQAYIILILIIKKKKSNWTCIQSFHRTLISSIYNIMSITIKNLDRLSLFARRCVSSHMLALGVVISQENQQLPQSQITDQFSKDLRQGPTQGAIT